MPHQIAMLSGEHEPWAKNWHATCRKNVEYMWFQRPIDTSNYFCDFEKNVYVSMNMIINCLCIPYQQSTSWTHWIPGLILLPACPLLVGESDWLRLSSTGPPPPSSCRGWTCWHESMSYSVDWFWGNVCRFSEEVVVQSQRNFSKTGNFVSLWI